MRGIRPDFSGLIPVESLPRLLLVASFVLGGLLVF